MCTCVNAFFTLNETGAIISESLFLADQLYFITPAIGTLRSFIFLLSHFYRRHFGGGFMKMVGMIYSRSGLGLTMVPFLPFSTDTLQTQ